MPTLPLLADTLAANNAVLDGMRQNADYHYGRDILSADESLLQLLYDLVGRWLNNLFGSEEYTTYAPWAYGVFATVVLVAVGCYLWYRHPALFLRNRGKAPLAYRLEEETIHGIDFERVMAEALGRGDYYEAVRALYLQTLKLLSDQKAIDWQPYKTPTQYVAEAQREPFSQLTRHFLRVRYGGFGASPSLFEELQACQRQLAAEWRGGEE